MKIAVISDIHLEFNKTVNEKEFEPSDVLILAGDIIPSQLLHTTSFFDIVCKKYEHVFYILGNHEYYHNNINDTITQIKQLENKYNNLLVLNDESIIIDGVVFIGSTLWSDFNKGDPLTLFLSKRLLNDYTVINKGNKTLNPGDVYKMHKTSLKYLHDSFERYKEYEKVVVITHHAPSFQSVHTKYKQQYHLNGNFYSELTGIIEQYDNVKYWVHGHTHENFRYTINECSIICHPYGYPGELNINSDYAPCIFEI